MIDLLLQIKESIVFLGFINNGTPVFTGTGFLIQFENIFYIVTAKHVVKDSFQDMFIFLNNRNFGVNCRPIKQILNDGWDWKKHGNDSIDIALLPFLFDSSDRSIFIPQSLFIQDTSNIQELVDLFFLSYQPEINERDTSISPIIRKGMVSRNNHDKTFFMDGFAFPGNSGSPVFLLPNNGQGEIRLAGIIGAYVPYRDHAISKQTGEIRAIFTENTGIALVHSTLLLKEIIDSKDFLAQHERLKNWVGNHQPIIQRQSNSNGA